jgi:hypothetical protein
MVTGNDYTGNIRAVIVSLFLLYCCLLSFWPDSNESADGNRESRSK